MHDLTHKVPCEKFDVYGVDDDAINALTRSIAAWLRGDNTKWNRSDYLNVYQGPQGKNVIELIFYHYSGPVGREIGSGGENNYCKMYVYEDHLAMVFAASPDDGFCSLVFKTNDEWDKVHIEIVKFLFIHLNDHLLKVFEREPARFSGRDVEVESVKKAVEAIHKVIPENV